MLQSLLRLLPCHPKATRWFQWCYRVKILNLKVHFEAIGHTSRRKLLYIKRSKPKVCEPTINPNYI